MWTQLNIDDDNFVIVGGSTKYGCNFHSTPIQNKTFEEMETLTTDICVGGFSSVLCEILSYFDTSAIAYTDPGDLEFYHNDNVPIHFYNFATHTYDGFITEDGIYAFHCSYGGSSTYTGTGNVITVQHIGAEEGNLQQRGSAYFGHSFPSVPSTSGNKWQSIQEGYHLNGFQKRDTTYYCISCYNSATLNVYQKSESLTRNVAYKIKIHTYSRYGYNGVVITSRVISNIANISWNNMDSQTGFITKCSGDNYLEYEYTPTAYGNNYLYIYYITRSTFEHTFTLNNVTTTFEFADVEISKVLNDQTMSISPITMTIYDRTGYDSQTLTISNAIGNITYKSSDKNICDFRNISNDDTSCEVFYVGEGTATVTIRAEGNNQYYPCVKTCEVTCISDSPQSIQISVGNNPIGLNEETTISTSLIYSSGYSEDVTTNASYTTYPTGIITIS